MKRVAFIGHRNIYDSEIESKLEKAIREQIEKGYNNFIVGSHGEFDKLVLSVCRQLRKQYKHIEIEVVLTSLYKLNKSSEDVYQPYYDVKTVFYEIEDIYFKKRITISNQKMIDNCDLVICYVDESRTSSGAKTAMNYAKKKCKEIINLFNKKSN